MRNAARGLHGVDDENAARRLDDLGDAIDRLDDAGLVVGGMDRDQRQAIGLVMPASAAANASRSAMPLASTPIRVTCAAGKRPPFNRQG